MTGPYDRDARLPTCGKPNENRSYSRTYDQSSGPCDKGIQYKGIAAHDNILLSACEYNERELCVVPVLLAYVNQLGIMSRSYMHRQILPAYSVISAFHKFTVPTITTSYKY